MRGKIINLNKINKVLKVLAKYDNDTFGIYVGEYSTSTITLYNKQTLLWNLGEPLVKMMEKENINWKISFKDNNMIINVW